MRPNSEWGVNCCTVLVRMLRWMNQAQCFADVHETTGSSILNESRYIQFSFNTSGSVTPY